MLLYESGRESDKKLFFENCTMSFSENVNFGFTTQSKRTITNLGQATKGVRWMPWR